MRLKNLIWLIILFFVVTSTATFFFYKILNSPIETKELPMHLKVTENPAVNIDTDALYFGGVPPSGSSTRQFVVSNNKENKIRAIFFLKGELSRWVKLSENNIILEPHAIKEANITVFVPSDAKLGNYTGSLVIEMRRG